ncbi:arylamine N-acetyltransferase [Stackebrandtia albiflava]|uniref:Arylamine N-acetyltransferase n=1 Tax=Stackebrandtia albiflava TaxID=406432 RepID=A0A562VG98_9ACTN|nr:arylamine N-acetyltransferase [Stackebrandtia albiflava]TWJ16912.1 arylamine N-acetyltransferase [Stackebrandtia albiflava]
MLSPSRLRGFLDRIGFTGTARPDLPTLTAIHRAMLLSVPYETLHIQLGRPVSQDVDDLYGKIVERRHGGFCYEMNGVLLAALTAIGFRVRVMAGAVHREQEGESAWRNHMVLLVHLDEGDRLVDAGLGDGFLEPLALAEGTVWQGRMVHRLERLTEEVWRCRPDPHGSVKSFDFDVTPRRPSDFAARCRELSTSPSSGFVRSLMAGTVRPDRYVVLRGRVCAESGPDVPGGRRKRTVADRDDFVATLADEFGLRFDVAEMDVLWRRACLQHAEHVAARERRGRRAATDGVVA